MAAVLNWAAYDAAFKEIYPDIVVANTAMKNQPLLTWMPKSDSDGGDAIIVPIQYGNPQSRSADASVAFQSTKDSSRFTKFVIAYNNASPRAHDYIGFDIDAETALASMSNVGAFMQAKQREIDSALASLGRSLGHALFGYGYGVRGTVATSGLSTTSLTLSEPADAYNFEIGMQIQLADEEDVGTTALKDSGDYVTLTGVNTVTGVLTADVAWSNISGAADGDFLIQRGDRASGSSAVAGKVIGLSQWIPSGTPAALFGVTRTIFRDRLAGTTLTATGYPKDQALQLLAVRIDMNSGGRASNTAVFMNPLDWFDLDTTLGARARYVNQEGSSVMFGFRGIELATPKGVVEIYADVSCPKGKAWMLDRSTWDLEHLGGLPHIVRDDGRDSARVGGSDSVEYRARYFAQLKCYDPSRNGVVVF